CRSTESKVLFRSWSMDLWYSVRPRSCGMILSAVDRSGSKGLVYGSENREITPMGGNKDSSTCSVWSLTVTPGMIRDLALGSISLSAKVSYTYRAKRALITGLADRRLPGTLPCERSTRKSIMSDRKSVV